MASEEAVRELAVPFPFVILSLGWNMAVRRGITLIHPAFERSGRDAAISVAVPRRVTQETVDEQ